MSAVLQAIQECLFGTKYNQVYNPSDEDVMAANVVRTIFSAEKGGRDLHKNIQDTIGDRGWTDNIRKKILGGIEKALRQGAPMGKAMQEASEKAIEAAVGFPHEHPYFTALIAVGVLAILMPFVLEALGFSELGPLEGSFAAWWQSTYGGYVPSRSLFSFLQRVGMVWRRSVTKSV